MNAPKRPNTLILPVLPQGDCRPTLVRPYNDRGGIFNGWGPKL
jgi:hypothetical protein